MQRRPFETLRRRPKRRTNLSSIASVLHLDIISDCALRVMEGSQFLLHVVGRPVMQTGRLVLGGPEPEPGRHGATAAWSAFCKRDKNELAPK